MKNQWKDFEVVLFGHYTCECYEVQDLNKSRDYVENFIFYNDRFTAVFLLDDGKMPLIMRYNPNTEKMSKRDLKLIYQCETGEKMRW